MPPGWVVLVALGLCATAYFIDRTELVPNFVRNGTLGLVLFYFGSR